MMAEGNFHDALGIYDQKGAIHWTRTQGEARAALVEQWAKDSARSPNKTRFVFAYTNDDVQQLNAALRAVRKGRGELGEDHELETAHGSSPSPPATASSSPRPTRRPASTMAGPARSRRSRAPASR